MSTKKAPKKKPPKKAATPKKVFKPNVEDKTKKKDEQPASTEGKKIAARIKGSLAKADEETKERIVSTIKKQFKKEGELRDRRKHWKDKCAQLEVHLKESIEEPMDEGDENNLEFHQAFRLKVITNHQALTEAQAGKGVELKELNSELTAIKKSVREQIANANQVGMKYD